MYAFSTEFSEQAEANPKAINPRNDVWFQVVEFGSNIPSLALGYLVMSCGHQLRDGSSSVFNVDSASGSHDKNWMSPAFVL